MSTPHSDKAKAFLKNQKYAQWHDATFWSVRTKRDNMALGLEEWEQLREKASEIKKHTISHLDEYLEKFASNADPDYIVTRAQGSDTIEVMKELGYTDAQIEEYLAEGAVVGKTALRK